MNKKQFNAMLESYLRNLVGQIIAAISIVTASTHVPVSDFSSHEWLLVAHAVWGSLLPVALRFVNKKDSAFGLVANTAAASVDKKLAQAIEETAKKPAAKKAPAKKATSTKK
jgi:hypothetical protein